MNVLPETIKKIEDAWMKMNLLRFLEKLMPRLKEHNKKVKIEVTQDL